MGSKPRALRKPSGRQRKPQVQKPRTWEVGSGSQMILELASKTFDRAKEDYDRAVSGAIKNSGVKDGVVVSLTGDKWTEVINPPDPKREEPPAPAEVEEKPK